jgi:very-short-patch-repair endonuclease
MATAEKRLWFDFLRHLPAKFTRQKPLGHYIADFYCASHRLVVEVDGDSVNVVRFTNDDVMRRFEAVCLEIAALLEKPKL